MASQQRGTYQSLGRTVCAASGKARYRNRRTAEAALAHAQHRADPLAESVPQAVYPCGSGCGGWHLTSRPQ